MPLNFILLLDFGTLMVNFLIILLRLEAEILTVIPIEIQSEKWNLFCSSKLLIEVG